MSLRYGYNRCNRVKISVSFGFAPITQKQVRKLVGRGVRKDNIQHPTTRSP
jgi:F0F1-type ATP synthase epsilon subunit